MWNFFDTTHDPETKTYLGEVNMTLKLNSVAPDFKA